MTARRRTTRTTRTARAALCALALSGAACAPRALHVTAAHPASPDAPTGRLAGPPPALRPGVAEMSPPAGPAPAPAPHQHHHHHHGGRR